MLKKILLALMFVITATTNVTHAESDLKTVASKAYVDTKIETKQLKIPAAGQPNVGAGETVMTYTSTGNGQIGERGLYSDISSYDATTDGDKLITASALNATFTNLPTTPTTKLECANQADGCTLWTIVDQTAYGDMLPSGYTRLEYIESTGTQYINTGIKNIVNLKMELTAQQTELSSGFPTLVGAQETSEAYKVLLGYGSGRKFYSQCGGAGGYRLLDIQDTNKHTFIVDNGTNSQTVSIDGNEFTGNYAITTGTNVPLAIFARTTRDGTSANSYTSMRVWSVKFWRDNLLIANFVPAKHGSDVGMYDTVTGTFFTNAATSGDDFTPGPPAN